MTVSTSRLQIAKLLPRQGEWTEDAYLWLSEGTNRLVELSRGQLEVLPMPDELHQRILIRLLDLLRAIVEPRGIVLVAPMRLRLAPGQIREPDLLLLLDRSDPRRDRSCWNGADLVVEILSPSNRSHDLVTKREEYAIAGIAEYWIVDPKLERLQVLRRSADDASYRLHATYQPGDLAASPTLPGLSIDVGSLFVID